MADTALQELANFLADRRRQVDRSQRAVGQRMNSSMRTVARIESGRENPTLETIVKIAAALDLELVLTFRDTSGVTSAEISFADFSFDE